MNTKFIALILILSCLVIQSSEMSYFFVEYRLNDNLYDELMHRKSTRILLAQDEEDVSMICHCGNEVCATTRVSFVEDGHTTQPRQRFDPNGAFKRFRIIENRVSGLLQQEEDFEFFTMLDQHHILAQELKERKRLEEREMLKIRLEVNAHKLQHMSILIHSLAMQSEQRYQKLLNLEKNKPNKARNPWK